MRFELAEPLPADAMEPGLLLELRVDSDGFEGDEHYVRIHPFAGAAVELVHETNRVKKAKRARSVFTDERVIYETTAVIDGPAVTARVPRRSLGRPKDMRFAASSTDREGDIGDNVPNGTPLWFRWTYEPRPARSAGGPGVDVAAALPVEVEGIPMLVTEFFDYAPGDSGFGAFAKALVPADRPDAAFHLAAAIPTDLRARPDWDVLLRAMAVDGEPPEALIERALLTMLVAPGERIDSLEDLEAVGLAVESMDIEGLGATVVRFGARPSRGWMAAIPIGDALILAVSNGGAIEPRDLIAALPRPDGTGPARASDAPPPVDTWSAVPTPPDAAFAMAGADLCLEVLELAASGEGPPAAIQDQRGPDGAAIVWSGMGWDASCLVHRDRACGFVAWHVGGGASGGLVGVSAPIMVQSLSRGPTMIEGHVSDEVTRVEIVTQAGLIVEATVDDGRFVAWWPGIDEADVIHAYGHDGEPLATVSGDPMSG